MQNHYAEKFLFFLFLSSFAAQSLAAGVGSAKSPAKADTDRTVILAELKNQLKSEVDHFYPASVDTECGGYFSDFDYEWQLDGHQTKMIVTQARHVWSLATVSMYFKEKEPYEKYASVGLGFLRDKMWDSEYGGFYDLVTREGKPIGFNDQYLKTAYGNAFAIYGLTAYYLAFGDTSALNLAIRTFEWMNAHSYDPVYGGYFQNMARNGDAYKNGFRDIPPKDQNSMIHIMEAFTELYTAWPNDTLKVRLDSLFHEVRDIAIGDKPYLTLFFRRDWVPISYRDSSNYLRTAHFEEDHISYGHNVETAYLLLETSKALHLESDKRTLEVGKWMDDYALETGWDTQLGGIFDGGYIFNGENKVTIIMPTKQWWAEIEAANSFLMMSQLYPHDRMDYYLKFCEQWNYIRQYLLDPKYGGWYWGGIDKAPENEKGPKATIWKAGYHTIRGMINCILRLEGKL